MFRKPGAFWKPQDGEPRILRNTLSAIARVEGVKRALRREFFLPFIILILLGAGFYSHYFWITSIILGIGRIAVESFEKMRRKNFSLDYIALLAMAVSLLADQHLAGAVVALMIVGGEALEEYAEGRAEGALRALAERIPKACAVRLPDNSVIEKPIQEVQKGETIIVKLGELVPLDGTLISSEALINESNLTGEALPVEFTKGEFVKSGSVNAGETMELSVETGFESSTYMRIVHLVDEAKKHQARVVRFAERFNFPFTGIALALAALAYVLSGEMSRALAVLVIATPCPLLIAAPVAFIGGLSRAARANIIVKRPATLEELARVKTVFFDKTGTLTLGEISLRRIERRNDSYSELEALAIAAAIEFHSIHPLARAVQKARTDQKAPLLEAHDVVETIGAGIAGCVRGRCYTVSKAEGQHEGIVLSLSENGAEVALFYFEDKLKDNVPRLLQALARRRISVKLLTGDRKENAERLFGSLGIPILAQCTPEIKFAEIDAAKKRGEIVAMVGDGLNDAPALAHAHVGIVFSGTENSAAIEAAHAVILGRDVMLIERLFETSARSVSVAGQSIWGGVVLSTVGMAFAALGFIVPVAGAILQEAIDVAVILNSLRSLR